jgi:fructokinase
VDGNVPSVLTVIGEALVDLVESTTHSSRSADGHGPRAGDGPRSYTAHPGGSPLNVAVGLARLGQPTALLARLSPDAFGRVLREHAERNGVDLSAAVTATEPTTLAVVSLDSDGRATYDFYITGTADWQWQAQELSQLPAGTTVLHTGSLAAWTPPGDAVIQALVEQVRASTTVLISYDPNIRARLLGTPEQGRVKVERSVGQAHVVKASDEDVSWLYPDRDVDQVAADWLTLGALLVVITRGGDGASAYRRGHPTLHRRARRIELVDTVGAGDAFMSGLLGAIVSGRADSPDALAECTDEVVGRFVDQAALVAALTCQRAGADPPTRAEVDAELDAGPGPD